MGPQGSSWLPVPALMRHRRSLLMEPIQNQCFNNERGDSGRETLWAVAPRGRCPHPGGRDGPLGTRAARTDPPPMAITGVAYRGRAPTAITAASYWGHRVVHEVPKPLGYSHLLLGNSVALGGNLPRKQRECFYLRC